MANLVDLYLDQYGPFIEDLKVRDIVRVVDIVDKNSGREKSIGRTFEVLEIRRTDNPCLKEYNNNQCMNHGYCLSVAEVIETEDSNFNILDKIYLGISCTYILGNEQGKRFKSKGKVNG